MNIMVSPNPLTEVSGKVKEYDIPAISTTAVSIVSNPVVATGPPRSANTRYAIKILFFSCASEMRAGRPESKCWTDTDLPFTYLTYLLPYVPTNSQPIRSSNFRTCKEEPLADSKFITFNYRGPVPLRPPRKVIITITTPQARPTSLFPRCGVIKDRQTDNVRSQKVGSWAHADRLSQEGVLVETANRTE